MKRSYQETSISAFDDMDDVHEVTKRACYESGSESRREKNECAPMDIECAESSEFITMDLCLKSRERLGEKDISPTFARKIFKAYPDNDDADLFMEVDETQNEVAPMLVEGREFYFISMDICI